MDSGVPGVAGAAVLRPVEEAGREGPGDVTLLLLLMEEMTVKGEL